MAGKTPPALQQVTGRVQKNQIILRKNTVFNEHPVQKHQMIFLPVKMGKKSGGGMTRYHDHWLHLPQVSQPHKEIRYAQRLYNAGGSYLSSEFTVNSSLTAKRFKGTAFSRNENLYFFLLQEIEYNQSVS